MNLAAYGTVWIGRIGHSSKLLIGTTLIRRYPLAGDTAHRVVRAPAGRVTPSRASALRDA
ncbi:hypothetical protein C0Z18_30405 [Trinickia dabaoshanensis]|uniref:Uncharacterized protein n=1 Tax=Trinickia dabaoshanensis TaxID=564714 RepID=A0A2N7VBZ4_9BURK|nr:hypothetical protein C0Z18_30405 [Trinickia dabaoshanensis]